MSITNEQLLMLDSLAYFKRFSNEFTPLSNENGYFISFGMLSRSFLWTES